MIPEQLLVTVAAVQEALSARRAGVLLVGPPGLGYTLVARHVSEIIPEPELDRVHASRFRAYATAGLLDHKAPKVPERPFRAPHHTVSEAGLCGVSGPYGYYTGEVALAIGGVLMLDELPEFRRSVVERLAERVGSMDFAERPFLIATARPCPCGFYGSGPHTPGDGRGRNSCGCALEFVERYSARSQALVKLLKLTVITVKEVRS